MMSPEAQLIENGMYKSMEHMTPAHLEGMEFDRKDLPCDMWGVAIMVLTRDLAEILNCVDVCSHLTRFIYAFGCVVLNLALQLSILAWVNMYVVGESVWTIQGNYAQFHREVFDKHGNFNSTAWEHWKGPRDDLCGAVLTKGVFLGVILFLWIGRMLGEFKTCVRLHGDMHALPNAPSGTTIQQLIVEREEEFHIIALTCSMRLLLFMLVIIPKIFICIILGLIGLQWLTATESFEDLILNALALEFVIGIDEQILEFFLPKRCTTNVEATKFAYPSSGPKTQQEKMHAVMHDYRRNIFYFIDRKSVV